MSAKKKIQNRLSKNGTSSPMKQRTLKNAIHCSGTALHSGAQVSMTLHPAKPNSGIVFQRSDLSAQGASIPAHWRRVCETRLCTKLSNDESASVSTVEHLMAALAGCGIDNTLIEINGGEVPVMDGSAAPFVFLIECAGVVEQDAPRNLIRILKPVSVVEEGRRASLTPADVFSIHCEIDFKSNAVAHQSYDFQMVNGNFKSEISRARTFGFLHEVDHLRANGLALGGSLDNAVVVSGDQILNEDGLRYDDEFVRHKVLDTIGDLYLAGGQIIGHFEGIHSGHALNRLLLETLFADEEAWCLNEIAPGTAPSHPAPVSVEWRNDSELLATA